MKLAPTLLSVMTMMMMTMRGTSGKPKTFLIETADHENQEALSLPPVGIKLGEHQADYDYGKKKRRRKRKGKKSKKKKRSKKRKRSKKKRGSKKTRRPRRNRKQPKKTNEVKSSQVSYTYDCC